MLGTHSAPRRLPYIFAGIALGVCSFAADARGSAAEPKSCPVPAGAERFLAVEALPQPLQEAVRLKLGPMAAPGQPFNDTDDVTLHEPPRRRLSFIWHHGRRWVVATELGGWASTSPLYAFEYSHGRASFLAEQALARDSDICGFAARLLTETPSPAPQ